MSVVKIQATPTGTGTVTITAPTTNTDQTVTLPDQTGTLYISGGALGTPSSGNGSNLTALNASNLGSGTVPTARLATGTANSTTYLRGDQTWATVSSTPTTAQVLSATAGAVFNDVGSYGLFYQNTASNIPVNSTVAGSSLRKINTSGVNASAGASGTWRMLGYQEANDTNGAICLWLRIS